MQSMSAQSTPDKQSESQMIHPIKLSNRELEVLKLMAEGRSNPEIAAALYLSTNTIKTHVRGILNKFGVQHRIEAVVFALRHQLI